MFESLPPARNPELSTWPASPLQADTSFGWHASSHARASWLPGECTGYDCADRLSHLVASAAPLRRALSAVAGELVRRKGWERLGFARLRDYATERAGVSARQLQELAHVDTGLAELPVIDEALRSGNLSWTQARLLCRVANRESEVSWLADARGMTTHALSHEVRAVDQHSLEGGGLTGEEEAPRPATLALRCSAATRAKWWGARQLAQRVAGEKLPVWACAEAIAAEVMSAVAVEVQPAQTGAVEPRGPGNAPAHQTRAPQDAPPLRSPRPTPCRPTPFLEALTQGLAACDAFELDSRLRRALRLEAEHLRELGPLLLEVSHSRGHRELGYARFDDFVREELGMSASRGRALLRIERLALCSTDFAAAWRGGRLSWTQADVLAPLFADEASRPWRSEWIEHAQRVTVRRLGDDVGAALASGRLDPALQPAAAESSRLEEEHQTRARPTATEETAEIFVTAPRDVARLFRAVLSTVQRRLGTSEGQALDAMLEHVFEVWGRNRPIPKKYRLFARDGWRCSAPGCTSYRNLHGHHIAFRSHGGSDDLANMTTLCAFHHLRGVHGGTLRISGEAPSRLRFELGLRAAKTPLMTVASGDVLRVG